MRANRYLMERLDLHAIAARSFPSAASLGIENACLYGNRTLAWSSRVQEAEANLDMLRSGYFFELWTYI